MEETTKNPFGLTSKGKGEDIISTAVKGFKKEDWIPGVQTKKPGSYVLDTIKANKEQPAVTTEEKVETPVEAPATAVEAPEEKVEAPAPAPVEETPAEAPTYDTVINNDPSFLEASATVEPVVTELGLDTANDEETLTLAKDKGTNIIKEEFGSDNIEQAADNAIQLDGWDRFAQIATGVSMALSLLSLGNFPVINFMQLTGADEKMKAARELEKNKQQVGIDLTKTKGEADISSEKLKQDITKTAEGTVEAAKTFEADEEAWKNKYKENHPKATSGEVEAAYSRYLDRAGKYTYGASGQKQAKEQEKDITKELKEVDLANDLKRLDAQTKSNLAAKAADHTARLEEIKAAAQEGRLTNAESQVFQKEMAEELQDLQNKSATERYAYYKQLNPTGDIADFNKFNRALNGGLQTTGEYVKDYTKMAVDTVTSFLGK